MQIVKAWRGRSWCQPVRAALICTRGFFPDCRIALVVDNAVHHATYHISGCSVADDFVLDQCLLAQILENRFELFWRTCPTRSDWGTICNSNQLYLGDVAGYVRQSSLAKRGAPSKHQMHREYGSVQVKDSISQNSTYSRVNLDSNQRVS